MDYDALAAPYAAHRRSHREVVDALRGGAAVGRSSRVLDVGCGTGSYIGALRASTGCSGQGVDPAREMLAVARARWAQVRFSLGTAEALPAPDACFDLVFSIDVIHHVADRSRSLREAFRVLRRGGRLCIGTEDEAMIRTRLHSRYFPETVDVELARYPSIGELVDLVTTSGFTGVRDERIASARSVADSRPYRDKAFSSLHLIPEAAHRRGLCWLERDLTDGPIVASVRQLLLWAEKP